MSLNLKTLGLMARLLDDREDDFSNEDMAELLEYARERAAREACEALADGRHPSLQFGDGADEGDKWLAVVFMPSRLGFLFVSGDGSTPTLAYEALTAALQERAK